MKHRRVLLALVLLAACGSDESASPGSGSAADSAGASTAVADTAPAQDSASAGSAAVVLAPDGLELPGAAGPAAKLAFGTGRAQVLAAVNGVLGAPAEQGTQEECPAGPLGYTQHAAGLHLQFQDSAFVGWSAPQGSALRTAAGIGPGSTLAQLKAAYAGAAVQETSLGNEFSAGELYGVVTGPADADKVEIIFAGTNCIFR